MFGALRRDRRALGRSQGARFHRDPAACGCIGTERYALLAGAPRRNREPQRREDALADRERAVAREPVGRARSWIPGLGCRAVQGARIPARPLEGRL